MKRYTFPTKRRRSTGAYPRRKPESNALERLLDCLFDGVFEEAPPSRDPTKRALQMLHEGDVPLRLPVLLAVLGLGGVLFGLWKLLESALMRGPLGRMYGASRAVRRQLLKTRKASTRLPPTPKALEAAWAKSRRSLEWKLRLGSMLEDLEPSVDQSYIRDDDGAVVGREPGIRGWLMEHCVEVFDHYKTAMGYKALAHRFRLAIDLPEPFTLEDVIDALSESIESVEEKEKAEREARRTKVKNSDVCAVADVAERAAEEGAELFTNDNCSQLPTNPNSSQQVTNLNHNAVVAKACGKAGKILDTLRKRNGKEGRPMARSMGVLDEILHDTLQLLHVPQSA